METGLLRDIFGNFLMLGDRYYFTPGEIEPMRGEIEMNTGKLGNSEKLKFPFWVEGPLVMIFGGWGWEWDRWASWGGLSGNRRGNGREPDGAGAVGARRDR